MFASRAALRVHRLCSHLRPAAAAAMSRGFASCAGRGAVPRAAAAGRLLIVTAACAAVVHSAVQAPQEAFAREADSTTAGGDGGSSSSGGGGMQKKKKQKQAKKEPPKEEDLVDLSRLQKWNRDWDGRRADRPRCTKTRYIVLVRHGQYHTSETEDDKRTLTELGHSQAALMVERVAALPWTPTRIWCSTMMRARQTADYFRKSPHFAGFSEYREDRNLREGRPYQTVPVHRRYTKAQVARDGARIDTAFVTLFHRADAEQEEDSYDVVVCHANVIRYFVCRALQLPPEAWLRFSLPHCSLTILAIRPSGSVSVRCLGDSGFLPGDWVTTS